LVAGRETLHRQPGNGSGRRKASAIFTEQIGGKLWSTEISRRPGFGGGFVDDTAMIFGICGLPEI